MHSLWLDLSPEERALHIRDVAAQVWAEGTDFQRETTAEMYGAIADDAAEDGALYAGVCFLALDDGEPAGASLVVRAEETDGTDAGIVALGIVEGLSTQRGREAYRTTAAGRPVAVVFSMLNAALDLAGADSPVAADGSTATEVPVATVEAYVPLPELARLLVLGISTPSLEIFPDLVALLSGITETVEVDAAGAAQAAVASATRAARADTDDAKDARRASRIMEI